MFISWFAYGGTRCAIWPVVIWFIFWYMYHGCHLYPGRHALSGGCLYLTLFYEGGVGETSWRFHSFLIIRRRATCAHGLCKLWLVPKLGKLLHGARATTFLYLFNFVILSWCSFGESTEFFYSTLQFHSYIRSLKLQTNKPTKRFLQRVSSCRI